MQKKVLVIHGWAQSNKGDWAIETNTFKLLKKIDPSIKIYLSSIFYKGDMRIKTENEKKLKEFDVEVFGGLVPTPVVINNSKNRFNRKLFNVVYFQFRSVLLLLNAILLRINKNLIFFEELQPYIKSNLYIVKGGTFILTLKGISGILFFYRIMFPFIIAFVLGKKILIFPHSFGPFHSKLLNFLLQIILNSKVVKFIFTRELTSVVMLEDIGVVKTKIYCFPDMAFLNLKNNKITQKRDPLKIALTLRNYSFNEKQKVNQSIYNSLLQTIAKFIRNHPDYQFDLFPQVIGPDPREDDRIVYNDLILRCNSKNIKIIDDDFSPNEIEEHLSHYQLLIGMRMHSIIFALKSGVKVIGISYLGPKHEGIFNAFGISDCLIPVELISYELLESKFTTVINTIYNFDKQLEAYKQQFVNLEFMVKNEIFSK